jgi:hypothetical protein
MDQQQAHAPLQEVGGIGVPQAVRGHGLGDARLGPRRMQGFAHVVGAQPPLGDDPREEQRPRSDAFPLQVGVEDLLQPRREGHEAVRTAFAVPDVQQGPAPVDVLDGQHQALAAPHSAAVQRRAQREELRQAQGVQHRLHFADGEHIGEHPPTARSRLMQDGELPLHHVGEEETHRRHVLREG